MTRVKGKNEVLTTFFTFKNTQRVSSFNVYLHTILPNEQHQANSVALNVIYSMILVFEKLWKDLCIMNLQAKSPTLVHNKERSQSNFH